MAVEVIDMYDRGGAPLQSRCHRTEKREAHYLVVSQDENGSIISITTTCQHCGQNRHYTPELSLGLR